MIDLHLFAACTRRAFGVVTAHRLASEGNLAISGALLTIAVTRNTLVPIKCADLVPSAGICTFWVAFIDAGFGHTHG